MRRRIAGILAAALMAVSAHALEADSLNRAVAVFMASNFKVAIENALNDLEATGLKVDTAAVKRYVAQEVLAPYNAAAHRAANQYIDDAITAIAMAQSDSVLAAAAARPGAVTLPSGLVLETLTEGTGAVPTADGIVTMRYAVSLPDGNVFDSIGPDDEPMTTPVAHLTKGVAEGLTHMKTGGNYRLTIPAELGYGSAGVPGVIPPDCVLQFVIELIDTKNDVNN